MKHRLIVIVTAGVATLAVAVPSSAAARSPAASWSPAGSPKQTVTQTSAAFVKGKVYMPGGWEPGFNEAFDKMQILTAKTNKWTIDAQPMPSGGMAQAAVCAHGMKVYVVNGISTAGALLNTLQIYDPSQPMGSRWSTGPAPFTNADGFLYSRDGGCAFIGKKLYLFGGQAQSSNGTINGISNFTWAYNPAKSKWSDTKKHMTTKRWVFGYTGDGSAAYVAGGEDKDFNYLQTAERFDPATGWSALADLPAPVGGGTGYEWPGLGLLGTSLAMFGGSVTGGSQGYQSRTLLCTLPCAPGASWTDANKNLVTARSEFAAAWGGSTPTLYAVDGGGQDIYETTAEKTT